MPKKEEYEKTKISPIIFAFLLIIVLLMFAIGRLGDKQKEKENNINNPTTTSTTTTTKITE